MTNPITVRAALASGFFLLAGISGVIAHLEIKSALAPSEIAFSIRSDNNLLRACLADITGLEGRLSIQSRRITLLETCDQRARTIIKTSSHSGFAWFVRSYSSYYLDRISDFNQSLLAAHQSGENEIWLAELRFNLGETALAQLSPENTILHFADLSLLLRSPRSVRGLAARYTTDPAFRPRVVRALAGQPLLSQNRFVAQIRRVTFETANEN